MSPIKAFIDSDVIISSLISNTGAAYLLLNKSPFEIDPVLSNYSVKETEKVCKRMNLNLRKLEKLTEKKFTKINLASSRDRLKEKFADYTSDPNDTHIITGAVESSARFLITYNLKHYNTRKIKNDFDILVRTPGTFLQFLRSKSK